jgi:hypothetical protein
LYPGLEPGSAFERIRLIGAFPGKFDIVAAKVAVGGSIAKGSCRTRLEKPSFSETCLLRDGFFSTVTKL